MDAIVQAWKALAAEPIAIVMALIALLCSVVAVSFGVRLRLRLATAALAIISAMNAWMMASHWRWPH